MGLNRGVAVVVSQDEVARLFADHESACRASVSMACLHRTSQRWQQAYTVILQSTQGQRLVKSTLEPTHIGFGVTMVCRWEESA